MYLDHFGLAEPPFRITPHTDFFFDGADRGATLEGLLYAIQYDEGIVKVSGEVGSGKTMLCRVLMERLPENVETIYLANPSFTRDEILRAIADDLKLATSGDSARVLMRELQEHLIASHASGRRVVILIDEAHAMPEDSLEQVRLLSNLETSRHKLLQIVLFGQPELEQMLAASSMRQLRDRITHSFRMRPLSEEEVGRYITFRLRAAGYRGPDLFTRRAVALLTRASSGLTRRINILADKALLSAFAHDTHAVDEKQVQRAIADSELPPIATAKRPLAYVAAALAAGAAIGMILQWVLTNDKPTRPQEATVAQSKPAAQSPSVKPRAEPIAVAPPRSEPAVVATEQRPPTAPGPGVTATAAPPARTQTERTKEETPAAGPPPRPSADKPSLGVGAAASTVPKPSSPAPPVAPVPVASTPVMQKAMAAPDAAVPAYLLPKQIERIDAYDTQGMRRLDERIAATREVLQSTPDNALSIELYLTLNTDPARIERFLIRAQGLGTLSQIYVIPLTGGQPTRVWVLFGRFATRAQAEEATKQLPESYRADFRLTPRDFAALRRPI